MRPILLALVTAALLAVGCGKYGAPVRPPAPSFDEGAVYDAGQPIERDR